MEGKARDRYFQEVAHNFLKNRGAPFFLSSKDLDLVAEWEEMGIPLRVVLEGIERAFGSYREKPGARRKIHSLAFCKIQVLRAFEQYKERKVGLSKMRNERDKKQKRIKDEVQKFLTDSPPSLSYLSDIYTRVQKVLSRRKGIEEDLERMEEEIEDLLFKNCPREEKERVKREIINNFPSKGEDEFLILFKIKLIKLLREKYKIPYVSFFYY